MAIIDKPDLHFNTVLYTGNGSTQSISGVGFAPDWVWLKERNNAVSHKLYDIVRGATQVLESDGTEAEGTDVNGLTSFNSDGFSVGSSISNNGSGDTYVSWNWKANGAGVSNTDGTITSTVSANTTSGFSIVSWTGTGATATVGHGLGTTPKMFIVRERSEARNWSVLTTAIDGSWDNVYLNIINETPGNSPQSADSSVFNFTSSNEFNASGQTYISYAFTDVKGFSKIGKYTGNGSTDGTFVYTGFKPAFILVKNTQTTVNSWEIHDNKRDTYNVGTKRLYPNASASEGSGTYVDMLSNGFKWRSTDGGHNSANTFIYLAIAEQPFVTSTDNNSIPATAR